MHKGIKILIGIIFSVFFVSLVSANNISLFPNPGMNYAGSNIQYSFNFTNSTNCRPVNNLISVTKFVQIDPTGKGFVSIDISNLTKVPISLCEGREGILRANHSFSDIVFNTVYAKYLNVSGNGIIKGRLNVTQNITASWFKGKINASYIQNNNWLEDSQQSNLNVNRSNFWDNYNTPSGFLWISGFNATGDTRWYLRSNPLGFYNSSTLPATTEHDPKWSANISSYYTKTSINSLGYYNSSNFIIANYYLKSNPYGFYNSSTLPASSEPKWNGNFSSVYFKSNPSKFWNSTFATFNKTYADTLYYGKSNPFGFYNSSNAYTKLLDPWSANITSYYTKTDINNLNYYNSSDFSISNYYTKTQTDNNLTTRYYLRTNPFGFLNGSTTYTKTQVDNNLTTRYYLRTNPFGFYNSSNAYTKTQVDNNLTTRYSTKAEPLWSGNKSLLVPYTGATTNVNLGVHNLTVNTNTLFVNTNGRVGIGTTGPTAKLEIDSAVTGNFNGLYISNSQTGLVASDTMSLGFVKKYLGTDYPLAQILSSNNVISDFSDGYLAFLTRTGNAAPTEKVRITSQGNVGIGTTSPKATLNVKGTLNITNSSGGVAGLLITSKNLVGIRTGNPKNPLNVIGVTNSTGGFVVGANVGITNTTGFWMCKDATCTVKCQVQINGGLITGCT